MRSTASRSLAAALFAAVLVLAAAPAPARSADTAAPNDTARYLAGLPPDPQSPLAALAKNPEWAQHARDFDAIFAREDANTLSKVRAFAKNHLTPPHDLMLYTFSGPDFLYATSFFPSAKTYVLAGLEPAGPIPQLTELSRGAVDATLHNLEGSLGTILNLSFFITKNMKTQLSTGPVYGTIPVLYVFLARTGKTVHDVSLVSLDGQGNEIAPDDADAKRKFAASAAKGVKITFTDGSGPLQTLYYFSTDLSDGGVKISGFLEFCDKLGPADSFIKSASYLLHHDSFARVRGFLVDHSATVLEDDSGVPLAYFDPKKWHLQPFGHYTAPLGIFPGTYQPRMAELFRNAAPLDFGIGYARRQDASSLLLAQRLPAGSTNEADINHALTTGSDNPAIAAEPAKTQRKRPKTAANRPRSEGLRGFFSVFGNSDSADGPSNGYAPRPRPPK
jgi:hypothetical protein